MAVKKGYGGKIEVGSDEIGEMGAWTLNTTVDISDISAFGDEWKKKTGLQKDWSGSCDGRLDRADTGQTALTLGADVTLKFYIDSSLHWEGPAVVESIDRTGNVAGVFEVTFNFTGNGVLAPKP